MSRNEEFSAACDQRQGHCYAFAFRHMLNEGGILVHGSATGADNHAWVDHGDVIYEPTHDKYYPKREYQQQLSPVESARYDSVTAMEYMMKQGHYGPWSSE